MLERILIVDDDAATLALGRKILVDAGYEVIAVADGDAALTRARAEDFDVLVTDLNMPRMDGFALLGAMREVLGDLQVIVLTAYASTDVVVSALREGACDFLQKPFAPKDLVASVAQALERKRLRCSTALYEASQRIIAAADSSQLAAVVVEVVKDVMVADEVSLMLSEPGRGLCLAYSSRLSGEQDELEIHLSLGERIAGHVAATREPLLLDGRAADHPLFRELEAFGRARSSIIYPLCRGEELLGVVNISRAASSRPYRRFDLERASILAAQVLLALENSRLMRRLVGTERLAAVGQVAAGVAHEINNPLSFVAASLESLSSDLSVIAELGEVLAVSTDPAVRAALARLEAEDAVAMACAALRDAVSGTARIRDIVGDLRCLARREQPSERPIDVNEALRSALRIAGGDIARKAKLRTELSPGAWVKADAGRLAQVFLNLLVNATQALPAERRAQNEIVVTSAAGDAEVLVSIADNGSGIDPRHRALLFQPFFTTKPPETGTGLGLSISREIIRGLGGDIKVSSEVDCGSVFTVALPRAAAPGGKGVG